MTNETTFRGQDPSPLRGLASGGVQLPGDEGYDRARTTWALAADLHPAAVAFPADAGEVAAVVRAAASAGLRVAPHSTGHNAQAFGDLTGTVLMRMTEMTGVEIDADARRAPGRGRRAVVARRRGGRKARPGSPARVLA